MDSPPASAPQRKFRKTFKISIAIRIEQGTPLKQLARKYSIDPATLRRWRDEHRALGTEAFSAAGRRRFSKEFKTAVVRSVERQTPLKQVGREFRINPQIIRKWWKSWRELGQLAFEDAIKGKQRKQAIIFRVSEREHDWLKAVAEKFPTTRGMAAFIRARLFEEQNTPPPNNVSLLDQTQRTRTVVIPLSSEERGRVRTMAKQAGARNLSEFIRHCILYGSVCGIVDGWKKRRR
jgi:transposase-like protein